MPYIITTKQPIDAVDCGHPDAPADGLWTTSSRAVATLFEASEEAAYQIEFITGADEAYEEMYTDAQSCSELGDTFGPLPDGTVIEVEHWDATRAVNWMVANGHDPATENFLDTYNKETA